MSQIFAQTNSPKGSFDLDKKFAIKLKVLCTQNQIERILGCFFAHRKIILVKGWDSQNKSFQNLAPKRLFQSLQLKGRPPLTGAKINRNWRAFFYWVKNCPHFKKQKLFLASQQDRGFRELKKGIFEWTFFPQFFLISQNQA